MTTYRVEFVSRGTASNRDAEEYRLRLYADGEYKQFFIALASGISMAVLDPQPGADFWQCFAEDAAAEVRSWVEGGGTPLDNPLDAVTLFPSVETAFQRSRSGQAMDSRALHEGLDLLTFDA